VLAQTDLPTGGGHGTRGSRVRRAGHRARDRRALAAERRSGELSACETALGRAVAARDIWAGARAAPGGKRCVLVSLWAVDDRATALLMERFYRAVSGDGSGSPRPPCRPPSARPSSGCARTRTRRAAVRSSTRATGPASCSSRRELISQARPFQITWPAHASQLPLPVGLDLDGVHAASTACPRHLPAQTRSTFPRRCRRQQRAHCLPRTSSTRAFSTADLQPDRHRGCRIERVGIAELTCTVGV